MFGSQCLPRYCTKSLRCVRDSGLFRSSTLLSSQHVITEQVQVSTNLVKECETMNKRPCIYVFMFIYFGYLYVILEREDGELVLKLKHIACRVCAKKGGPKRT
jgi:hypothetical protein